MFLLSVALDVIIDLQMWFLGFSPLEQICY